MSAALRDSFVTLRQASGLSGTSRMDSTANHILCCGGEPANGCSTMPVLSGVHLRLWSDRPIRRSGPQDGAKHLDQGSGYGNRSAGYNPISMIGRPVPRPSRGRSLWGRPDPPQIPLAGIRLRPLTLGVSATRTAGSLRHNLVGIYFGGFTGDITLVIMHVATSPSSAMGHGNLCGPGCLCWCSALSFVVAQSLGYSGFKAAGSRCLPMRAIVPGASGGVYFLDEYGVFAGSVAGQCFRAMDTSFLRPRHWIEAQQYVVHGAPLRCTDATAGPSMGICRSGPR